MKKNSLRYLTGRISEFKMYILITFVIGCVVGFVTTAYGPHLLEIEIKKEVSVDQIFNFFIAVVFAFVLQNIFQKSISNKRVEKDLLIDQIKTIVKSFEEIQEQFAASREKQTVPEKNRLLTDFRRLFNVTNSLERRLEQCRDLENQQRIKDFSGFLFSYKRLLTEDEFTKGKYSAATYRDAGRLFTDGYDLLFEVIFAINNL